MKRKKMFLLGIIFEHPAALLLLTYFSLIDATPVNAEWLPDYGQTAVEVTDTACFGRVVVLFACLVKRYEK
jgi:hypothetical protein